MRYLFVILLLVGCTTPPVTRPRLDMATFQADCRWAAYQLTQLELSLEDYTQAKMNDYSYYQSLKNNIWAIKSTCRAYRS